MAELPLAATVGVPHPVGDLSGRRLDPQVPVYLFSGRNLIEDPTGIVPFGNQRSDDLQPHVGIARVAIGEGLSSEELLRRTTSDIPKRKRPRVELKRIDHLPRPGTIDPRLLGQQSIDFTGHPWISAIRHQLDQSKRRHIYLFVHGYNTHLITNTEMAAEMYHRSGRDGAVIAFEWPSLGKLIGYIHDKGNATASTRHFRSLLVNLARQTDPDGISILAHSAGNPIVANALREIRLIDDELNSEELQEKYRIHRVIMAAPDMDVMEFLNCVLDGFYLTSGGVAVYASPEDKALQASAFLFQNKRLGQAVGQLSPVETEVLRLADRIELIDVGYPESFLGDFLGHGYFLRNPWVSSDLGLFLFGRPPEERGLVRSSDGVFWHFPADYPDRLTALGSGASEISGE